MKIKNELASCKFYIDIKNQITEEQGVPVHMPPERIYMMIVSIACAIMDHSHKQILGEYLMHWDIAPDGAIEC